MRILIVDDYPHTAERLGRFLKRRFGGEIEIANDGVQAIKIAEEFRPEVVLLDIGLPRLDGYETAKRIRDQPWGKLMKLVALTGWTQDEDLRLSQEAGFDAHIAKPIHNEELSKLLTRIVLSRNAAR